LACAARTFASSGYSGTDATHLRDEGLQRLPNGGIFEKAIAESRVVVNF